MTTEELIQKANYVIALYGTDTVAAEFAKHVKDMFSTEHPFGAFTFVLEESQSNKEHQ